MVRNGPSTRRMWFTHALLDYGDHGLGAVRRDPHRVGVLELTDRARWVPSQGEGWDVPIEAVRVASKRRFLGLMFDGLELEIPGVGELRLRAMNFAPSVPLAPTDRVTGDARATGRLRRTLLARGAADASGEPREVDPLL